MARVENFDLEFTNLGEMGQKRIADGGHRRASITEHGLHGGDGLAAVAVFIPMNPQSPEKKPPVRKAIGTKGF